jgi:signal transduction histidine kinase
MDAITVAGSKARRKGVTVVLDLEPDVPAVWGNGGELNQVWSNLLDNAIDAAGDPGHVDVSVRREVQWVVVHFVDNGAGIPPEVQKRMFDAFFTTKPVGQGTGLGLDIAQRIVRRYNGSIEVDSHPGRTEFRVRFPVPGASHAPVADASGNS